jgi:hypothetical protein
MCEETFSSDQTLSDVDKETICSGVMSMVFYYPAHTIKIEKVDGYTVQVLLPQKEDSQMSKVRCQITGDRIIWKVDGKPWNYQNDNATMTFSIGDKDITLVKRYPDGFGSKLVLQRR